MSDLLADRVEEGVGVEKVAEIHGPVQQVSAGNGSFPPRQRRSLARHSRQPSLGSFWPFPQTRPVAIIQVEGGERVQKKPRALHGELQMKEGGSPNLSIPWGTMRSIKSKGVYQALTKHRRHSARGPYLSDSQHQVIREDEWSF